MPAEHYLSRCFSVFSSNRSKYRIFKQTAAPLAKRCPCFNLHLILIHIFFCKFLLVKWVCLHLIYHRFDFRKGNNIHQTIRVKVGYTDGSDPAFLIQFFQSPVSTIIVCKRLMQQDQIKIRCLQFFHRSKHRLFCLFIAVMLNPYLCRQENILSCNARLYDGIPHLFLIKIALRCVQ